MADSSLLGPLCTTSPLRIVTPPLTGCPALDLASRPINRRLWRYYQAPDTVHVPSLPSLLSSSHATLFLIRRGADPFPLFPFRNPQSSLAAWRRCGSQFPGVVDQIQRSIGNGLGYTKRKPCCCVSSCSFTILVLSKPLHLYLLFSLYNSPSYTSLLSFKSSFLHLFFI